MSEDYHKIKFRVKSVEEAMQILTKLALRADERMDDFDGALNNFDTALNNLTVKVEALADAQIRAEETLTAKIETFADQLEAVADAQIRITEMLARKIGVLADAHGSLTAKVEALTDVQIRMGESLAMSFGVVTDNQLLTGESLGKLMDLSARLVDSHTQTAAAQARLADAQSLTERRLDALIDIVREGRTGGAA